MPTNYLLCHAASDENDAAYGGHKGDNKGFELNATKWYNPSTEWGVVYRHTDANVREEIASFMEKAVINGFIGYSTNRNQRDTLFSQLELVDFNIGKVITPCSADCSSLVYCAIYKALGIKFEESTEESTILCPRTGYYPGYIDKCGGFEKFETAEYLTSDKLLKRGDILLSFNEHIAVWT